ncbi:hypothetical protein LTR17_023661 [Elasticomyces elasticus]|nr:hypothetical protein LTR17_023661 [Elasticomyces elasticus]
MPDGRQFDPRIKAATSFVHNTEPFDIRDEIGHGTHALGLLLKVATCAEVYIAKIASRDTLSRENYNDIAKIGLFHTDIISMSFGIREYHEPMKAAISNALYNQTLIFAAASNDGGNSGRAFPATYPGVFCIHSTDGNGNPSNFNPVAHANDNNFSLLGEYVYSHWPIGLNGHNEAVNALSGTSAATPIAAGLAASVMAFVRQQEQGLGGSETLGPWLKDTHSMAAVLKAMVRRRDRYDYITPQELLDTGSSREHVYDRIKEIRRHMYD